MSNCEVRRWRHKPTGAIITVPIGMRGLGHTWEAYDDAAPSRLYSLNDLTQLAEEYANEIHDTDHALTPRLVLSIFIEWARKREREVGDAGD